MNQNEEWLHVKEGKQTTFYPVSRIEKLGSYDATLDGRRVWLKGSKAEIFISEAQVQQLYLNELLNLELRARLTVLNSHGPAPDWWNTLTKTCQTIRHTN